MSLLVIINLNFLNTVVSPQVALKVVGEEIRQFLHLFPIVL